MIDPCCQAMRNHGRDHYKEVPESDLPDALIEVDRARGMYAILVGTGPDRYGVVIRFARGAALIYREGRATKPLSFPPSSSGTSRVGGHHGSFGKKALRKSAIVASSMLGSTGDAAKP